jgi:hypothetical protein
MPTQVLQDEESEQKFVLIGTNSAKQVAFLEECSSLADIQGIFLFKKIIISATSELKIDNYLGVFSTLDDLGGSSIFC